jgi:hypothetical protein
MEFEDQEQQPVIRGETGVQILPRYNVDELAKLQWLYYHKKVRDAIKPHHGFDQYGAMWFETRDVEKGIVICINETYARYPAGYAVDPNRRPDLLTKNIQVNIEGQVLQVRIKYYFRTFRDILWPDIASHLDLKGSAIQDCVIGACKDVVLPVDACCGQMFDHFVQLQHRWIGGHIARTISRFLEQNPMCGVKTIVCYQFGRLFDQEFGIVALFRHLFAYALQQVLMRVQPPEARNGEPIHLIAADNNYGPWCQNFLSNFIWRANVDRSERTSGFTILGEEFECFLPDYLTRQTIFISFKPRDICFVPVFGLCCPRNELVRYGPAALVCPEIASDGTKAPTLAEIGCGEARIDSSPDLKKWKSEANSDHRVLSLDDSAEPDQELQGLSYMKNERTVMPKMYLRIKTDEDEW